MTILAFAPSGVPPAFVGYEVITGQIDLLLNDNAEIDLGQAIYDEYLTLAQPPIDIWAYVYTWKVALFLNPLAKDKLTSFSSNPTRYKFGHLTVSTNSGVVWNDVWTFEDQVSPLFRGFFYTDNPNPGDGFPFGTVPLGDSEITVWRDVSGQPQITAYTQSRGTFLNTFLFKPTDYLARISYNIYLSWTALDILAVAPKPFVVVYP